MRQRNIGGIPGDPMPAPEIGLRQVANVGPDGPAGVEQTPVRYFGRPDDLHGVVRRAQIERRPRHGRISRSVDIFAQVAQEPAPAFSGNHLRNQPHESSPAVGQRQQRIPKILVAAPIAASGTLHPKHHRVVAPLTGQGVDRPLLGIMRLHERSPVPGGRGPEAENEQDYREKFHRAEHMKRASEFIRARWGCRESGRTGRG